MNAGILFCILIAKHLFCLMRGLPFRSYVLSKGGKKIMFRCARASSIVYCVFFKLAVIYLRAEIDLINMKLRGKCLPRLRYTSWELVIEG